MLFLSNPQGVSAQTRRHMLNSLQKLNQKTFDTFADPETQARIAQYELAFRMQMAVPELTDFANEDAATLELYGCQPGDGSFASNCLLARRLAERGTRFIQLYHRGWDHHGGVKKGVLQASKHVDQATAALLIDLKRRGLLDDTLVVWAGEFGRTPSGQNGNGRDHNNKGYTTWMAGGGVKGGFSFGATDDTGGEAVEGKCHIHDWHATILHLLGLDHEKLTYRYAGRDFRLTDVAGNVLNDIVA